MSETYINLYSSSSQPECAFLLEEGAVYFYVTTVDKYAITGKNLIVGATEVIMKHISGTEVARIETAVANGSSSLKRIPAATFISGMDTFSFALNVCMVLAKQVVLTNHIIQKNMAELEGDEKKIKEYSMAYFGIIERLRREYEKRKLPWLRELVQEFESSLTYKKGEAYRRTVEPAHITVGSALSEKDVEFQRGSVICEEGTPGEEMFILKSGSIDVMVRGQRVATIDEPGAVIGETALLLGEKRNATLKAKNTVIVTRIRKDDLREAAEVQSNFMIDVAATLSKRHYYNTVKITSVSKSLVERELEEKKNNGKTSLLSQRAYRDLSLLKSKVEDIARSKKADFLDDLLNGF